jgi:hypothetical protein
MARGRKSSWRMVLSREERQTLDRWQRSTTMAAGLARGGQLIRLRAAGHAPSHVAQAVGVQRTVVRQGARRLLAQRRDGLADAPGRGATGVFSPRRRDPRGAAGLRASRYAGPQPLPVGWRRTGTPAHGGGAGGGQLRGDRAADARQPSAPAVAPPSLAGSQAPTGRRLGCDRLGTQRARHASTA